MKLGELYKVRDLSIRDSILARLSPDERERLTRAIDDGFVEGNQIWHDEHLATILGPDEAQRMHKLLDKGTLRGTKIKVD